MYIIHCIVYISILEIGQLVSQENHIYAALGSLRSLILSYSLILSSWRCTILCNAKEKGLEKTQLPRTCTASVWAAVIIQHVTRALHMTHDMWQRHSFWQRCCIWHTWVSQLVEWCVLIVLPSITSWFADNWHWKAKYCLSVWHKVDISLLGSVWREYHSIFTQARMLPSTFVASTSSSPTPAGRCCLASHWIIKF